MAEPANQTPAPGPEGTQPRDPLTPAQRMTLLRQKEAAIRKRLWQSALLALTAFIAICAVGIAWFVNNSRVTGGGVQVQTSGPAFELASVGTSVGVTASPQPTGEPTIIGSKTYSSTSGSNTLVAWMVDANSHLNNLDAQTIHPGSSGKITFYVLPKQANLGEMSFTLSTTPYAVGAAGADGAVTINQKIYAPLTGTAATRTGQLLAGHLLFFAKWNETTRTYTEQLTPGTAFSSTILDAVEGNITGTDPVAFTIYWVWPELFRYYIDTGTPGCLFADSSAMIAKINAGQANYFSDTAGGVLTGVPTVSAAITTQDLNTCSGYYNNADQYLGTQIRYLQFQLDADQAAAS